ncbi:MAG: CHASE domain-containing protein [Pseudomonadota bacterium]
MIDHAILHSRQKTLSITQTLLAAVLFAAIYYLAARVSLLLAFNNSNATPVWPPSGLAFATLTLLGLRFGASVFIGALAANVATFHANGLPIDAPMLAVSCAIGTGNALEALLGAHCMRTFLQGSDNSQLQDTYRFAVIALAVSTVSAGIGTLSLTAGGMIPPAAAATVLATWWIGDASAIIVIAPVLLTWARRGQPWRARLFIEAVLALLLIALLAVIVFERPYTATHGQQWLAFCFIVCISVAAHRYGLKGASAACLVIASCAVLGTIRGLGPFASSTRNDALIALESFIILCSLVSLITSADMRERRSLKLAGPVTMATALHWGTLLLCIGLSMLVWQFSILNTERRAQEQFQYQVTGAQQRIARRIALYQSTLRSAQAFYRASEEVTRAEWHNFVETLDLDQNFPGVQAFGFARSIGPAQLQQLSERMHAEGFPDFTIRPAGERAVYHVVEHIEPFTGRNMLVFGYDLSSETVRRQAIEQARRSYLPTLSGKVQLIQDRQGATTPGVLIFAPVYLSTASRQDVLERAPPFGLVYGAFRVKDMMRGVLGVSEKFVRLDIFDGGDTSAAGQLYASAPLGKQERDSYPNPLLAEMPLDAAGHRWTLRFTSMPAFESFVDRQKDHAILLGGVIISLLFFSVMRALTARHSHALALANEMADAFKGAETRFEGLVNAATDFAIVSTDLGGKITVFSAGAQRMLGYRAEDMLAHGRPSDFFAQEEIERLRQDAPGADALELLTRHVREHEAESSSATFVRADGSTLPVSVFTSAVLDSDGNTSGYLWVAKDITVERDIRHSLQVAKEQAELASQMKSGFVANMSHEIRTPLNAVLGMTHLLESTALSADQHKYLGMIKQSGSSLLRILNDVLDLSKIESGRLEFSEHAFVLDDVVEAIAAIMTVNAGEKNLDLTIGIAENVPRQLVGDALRLQQILTNLVGNAIKFTERGCVALRIEALSTADGAVTLAFAVRDTGIGIGAEALPRLFTAFDQADASINRRFGGTGLGLVISLRLAHLGGGDIAASSRAGEGSEFVLTMPFRLAPGAAAAPGAWSGLSFLLVDEHAASLADSALCIEHGGGACHACASAQQALALLEEGQAAGRRIADIILFDCKLPGDDGIAALQRMRALAQGAQIILMSNAFGRGSLLATDHGREADALMLKPVTLQRLAETVNGLRKSAPGGTGPAPGAPGARLGEARILLVEDNPINQIVAVGMLEQVGAQIVVAENGSVALDLLAVPGQRFDVVLMDVQMPVMDGIEATRRIRSVLQLDVPVIAMSAAVMQSEKAACSAAGMSDFIAKPIEFDDMLATILKYLSPGPSAAHAATPAPAPAQQEGAFDIGALLRLSQDSVAKMQWLQSLLAKTLADGPQQFGAARAAWQAGDNAAVGKILHGLRGTVGSFGARRFTAAALQLETALRERQSDAVAPLFDLAGQELAATVLAGLAWLADDERKLQLLKRLLQEDRSDAVDAYEELRAALHSRIGVAHGVRLDLAIHALDFPEALRLLEDC